MTALLSVAGVVAGCSADRRDVGLAPNAHDLGYAVTMRDGVRQLTIALCGERPPKRLVIVQGMGADSTGERPLDLADVPEDQVLVELDESDWTSNEQTFSLGPAPAVPPVQRLDIFTEFDGFLSWSRGGTTMPDPPWPTFPLALTSPFDFQRQVRLDTARGDLCERR